MTISVNNFNYGSYSLSGGVNFGSNTKYETPVDVKTDVVEISKQKEKKSAWKKFKNGFTSVEKFFITTGEYIKGAAKGIFYGGATALCVLGGDAIRNAVKKSPKSLSVKGKILAGAAGAAVLGWNLFNANLNANQKNADVDHRWQTGHNEG